MVRTRGHGRNHRRCSWLVVSTVLLHSLLFITACDDGNAPVDIRGGERLAWDQAGDSPVHVRAMTFNLYVDNALSSLSDVRCSDTARSAEYECSGGLPSLTQGRHLLELTAVFGGAESARSRPLAVNVTPTAPPRAFVAVEAPDRGEPSPKTFAPACPTGTSDCHAVHVVADGLGLVSGLSPTADDRLFFIEDATRVRVIAGNTLVGEPALVLDDADGRIVGLTVDQDFANNSFVFVAWTERSRHGELVANVTRYREFRNVLAQGAVIVTDLPVPPDAYVPMAVDDRGLLHVALPAIEQTIDQQPSSGVLLRYTRDGLAPETNPRSSPVLGYGFSSPTGIAIGPQGAVWLSGNPAGGWRASGLATLTESSSGDWPLQPFLIEAPGVLPGSSSSPPSVLSRHHVETDRTAELFLVVAPRIYIGTTSAGRLVTLREVSFDSEIDVLAASQAGARLWTLIDQGSRRLGIARSLMR